MVLFLLMCLRCPTCISTLMLWARHVWLVVLAYGPVACVVGCRRQPPCGRITHSASLRLCRAVAAPVRNSCLRT
jgi:hypothetical protein